MTEEANIDLSLHPCADLLERVLEMLEKQEALLSAHAVELDRVTKALHKVGGNIDLVRSALRTSDQQLQAITLRLIAVPCAALPPDEQAERSCLRGRPDCPPVDAAEKTPTIVIK